MSNFLKRDILKYSTEQNIALSLVNVQGNYLCSLYSSFVHKYTIYVVTYRTCNLRTRMMITAVVLASTWLRLPGKQFPQSKISLDLMKISLIGYCLFFAGQRRNLN